MGARTEEEVTGSPLYTGVREDCVFESVYFGYNNVYIKARRFDSVTKSTLPLPASFRSSDTLSIDPGVYFSFKGAYIDVRQYAHCRNQKLIWNTQACISERSAVKTLQFDVLYP
jgi:hypothetical protein